jgi:SnoaL-like polyketide cyclase
MPSSSGTSTSSGPTPIAWMGESKVFRWRRPTCERAERARAPLSFTCREAALQRAAGALIWPSPVLRNHRRRGLGSARRSARTNSSRWVRTDEVGSVSDGRELGRVRHRCFVVRFFCVLHDWDSVSEACPACRSARPRERERILRRAIASAVSGDISDIDEMYTQDVTGWGPATTARCREELAIEVEERARALTQVEVTFGDVETRGDSVLLQWESSALHVGPLVLERSGVVLEPTGLPWLRVRAVTVAKFRGSRICSWRSHWEDLTLAS